MLAPYGGLDRRVLDVLLHEGLGGAVDVEVGDHGPILGRVDPRIYFRIKSPHLTRGWRIQTFNANRFALPDKLFRAALRLIESWKIGNGFVVDVQMEIWHRFNPLVRLSGASIP